MRALDDHAEPRADGVQNQRGLFATASRGLKRASPAAWFGVIVVLLYVSVALLAPVLAPYGESEIVSSQSYAPWSEKFIFGTDQLGRDLLSRLIYGARNTIGIALLSTVLAFAIGGALGILAALWGKTFDLLLSRLVDALMAVPQLIFVLILLSVFGNSIPCLILVVAALTATQVFRLARSVAMNVVVMEYVEDAKLRGENLVWIVSREILPNILPTLIAEFGMRFCFVFLTFSALSFLGLGIQPPTADWGSMVRESATLISYGDITPLLPAGAIALLTVAVNFVVDWFLHSASGLRDEH
ncbi:ABC transporter permease [Mesorhizobium shangrilense]|uniref:ABC transporter permease n=1 Tax=Mesorhizobium shangrilense TaxID=460060 RepID=A0ABV2DPZ8_9HYPH